MSFKVPPGCKTAQADWTLVGPFPCVGPQVDLQGRVAAQHLPTKAADVLRAS